MQNYFSNKLMVKFSWKHPAVIAQAVCRFNNLALTFFIISYCSDQTARAIGWSEDISISNLQTRSITKTDISNFLSVTILVSCVTWRNIKL